MIMHDRTMVETNHQIPELEPCNYKDTKRDNFNFFNTDSYEAARQKLARSEFDSDLSSSEVEGKRIRLSPKRFSPETPKRPAIPRPPIRFVLSDGSGVSNSINEKNGKQIQIYMKKYIWVTLINKQMCFNNVF